MGSSLQLSVGVVVVVSTIAVIIFIGFVWAFTTKSGRLQCGIGGQSEDKEKEEKEEKQELEEVRKFLLCFASQDGKFQANVQYVSLSLILKHTRRI